MKHSLLRCPCWLNKNQKAFFVCCFLIVSLLGPTVSVRISKAEKPTIQQPTNLYGDSNDPCIMVVWNKTEQLDEMVNLASYGNYSVLICSNVVAPRDEGPDSVEYILVASTLQPDAEGLIHQLVIRFGCDIWHNQQTPDYSESSFPIIKSYTQTYSYNQTSLEDGKKDIEDFIAQQSLNPSVLSDKDFCINSPFLSLSNEPFWGLDLPISNVSSPHVGATIILNLCTGKVMFARLIDWGWPCMETRLLYPDWEPPSEDDLAVNIVGYSFQAGDGTNGSICLSLGLARFYDLPWVHATIDKVLVNGTTQNCTNPPLPLTMQPSINPSVTLNVTLPVTPGDTYEVNLVSQNGTQFWCPYWGDGKEPVEIDVPPPVCLYVEKNPNVRFYSVDDVKKIDFQIGNAGSLDANIVQFFVGTSQTAMQEQVTTPVTIQSNGLQWVTVNYNWSYGVTYYFKAVCSAGESLISSVQAPLAPIFLTVAIEPENVTANVGDVFNVSVIAYIPANPGLASAEFHLSWDPTVVKVLGMHDVIGGDGTLGWDELNNTEGQLTYIHALCDESVSGNPVLAIITLEAVSQGSTNLHFTFVAACSDSTGEVRDFNCEAFDGNVTVEKAVEKGNGTSSNVFSNSTGTSNALCNMTIAAANAGNALIPSTAIANENVPFSVNLNLVNITDMMGYEYTLCWNSSVLNCTSAETYLPNTWQDQLVMDGVIHPENYHIACSGSDPQYGYNGTMTLATFTFDPVGKGTTQLTITYAEICDSNEADIAISTSNCSITVKESHPSALNNNTQETPTSMSALQGSIPEFSPASLLLIFMIFSAALTVLARRQRKER